MLTAYDIIVISGYDCSVRYPSLTGNTLKMMSIILFCVKYSLLFPRKTVKKHVIIQKIRKQGNRGKALKKKLYYEQI